MAGDRARQLAHPRFLAAGLVCWIGVHDDTLLQKVQAIRLSYQLTKVVGTLASLQYGA